MSNLDDALKNLPPETIAVLGVPLDVNSSFMKGSALAPRKIREALHCDSTNMCAENGVDLARDSRWLDLGDMAFSSDTAAFDEIEKTVETLLERNANLIALGGDHSITHPIVRAYARSYPRLNILHLDAHPDLYDELDGNRNSHACPFARIMEESLAARLVQAGIRTMTPHQREQAKRFEVEVIEMRKLDVTKPFEFEGPVYLSLDLDCLDPAFAPGVSHHEPGGLSTRALLTIIQNLKGPLVGADIVEYNPTRDLNQVTAMTAAKLPKEIITRITRVGPA